MSLIWLFSHNCEFIAHSSEFINIASLSFSILSSYLIILTFCWGKMQVYIPHFWVLSQNSDLFIKVFQGDAKLAVKDI